MSLPIIFIVGPTAIGKTEIAYLLACRLGGQIISADSMLVYREPRIITSKPPPYILREIKHYFVGNISVTQNYDVYQYSQQAGSVVNKLIAEEIPIIVCGGSGLYIKALLDGIVSGPSSKALRLQLRQQAEQEGSQYLWSKLKAVDSQAADKLSVNDTRRIIRALEVYQLSGQPISAQKQNTQGIWGKYRVRIFGIRAPRSLIYSRINQRADQMFATGALEEVSSLLELPLSLTARKIIAVSEVKSYLEGKISWPEAKRLVKRNTRRFAKRQLTWFKADKRIEWLIRAHDTPEVIANQIISSLKISR